MEKINITKKSILELSIPQIFGRGRNKINLLWFDWKEGDYVEDGITKRFAGSKYMVAVIGTKKEALNLMHEWLTTGNSVSSTGVICWIAKEDKNRKRLPLCFNWQSWKQ